MTCSGTYAALKAGQEAPRCSKCDAPLLEWSKGDPLDCGCEAPYGVIPMPTERIVVPTQDHAEYVQVRDLLLSLRARWVPVYKGYALTPGKCAMFERLFGAGAEPVKPSARSGPVWLYRFPASKGLLNIYGAADHMKRIGR